MLELIPFFYMMQVIQGDFELQTGKGEKKGLVKLKISSDTHFSGFLTFNPSLFNYCFHSKMLARTFRDICNGMTLVTNDN
jgi:hypothetical protein